MNKLEIVERFNNIRDLIHKLEIHLNCIEKDKGEQDKVLASVRAAKTDIAWAKQTHII